MGFLSLNASEEYHRDQQHKNFGQRRFSTAVTVLKLQFGGFNCSFGTVDAVSKNKFLEERILKTITQLNNKKKYFD